MATKPTTPRTPKTPGAKAAKQRAVPKAAKPTVEGEAKATAGLRMKDLVDKVTATTGVKKQDVKTVVEAVLTHLGETLKKGESLNLAGLGRMRVAKPATEDGGAITLKLRMGAPGKKAAKPGAEPLADGIDQD